MLSLSQAGWQALSLLPAVSPHGQVQSCCWLDQHLKRAHWPAEVLSGLQQPWMLALLMLF